MQQPFVPKLVFEVMVYMRSLSLSKIWLRSSGPNNVSFWSTIQSRWPTTFTGWARVSFCCYACFGNA